MSRPIAEQSHWPELNVLALVLEDQRKSVSSTNGMRDSVLTSELLPSRVSLIEEKRMQEMENSIKERNFKKLAELTMKDSNSFHSICMDTYPPLFYLNDKSKDIIQFVNMFNCDGRELKAAYSFDAGPNAFLFVLDENLNQIMYLIYKIYFSNLTGVDEFLTSKLVQSENSKSGGVIDFGRIKPELKFELDLFYEMYKARLRMTSSGFSGIIKYVIHSKVGEEPAIYDNDWNNSILDQNGQSILS